MDGYVLIVDDDATVRELVSGQVRGAGHRCRTASNVEQGLRIARAEPRPDLVLSDIDMPGGGGVSFLHQLKELDETIQVVMVSGMNDLDVVRQCVQEGAYDYVSKPFELDDMVGTVARAIEHGRLLRQNESYRLNLERMVLEQTEEIRETRDIAILTLAKLAESRDAQTGRHLERISQYSRRLAERLRKTGYQRETTDSFIELLTKSSPLHDIGKVGIPDSILLKPGPLDPAERRVMQRHTTIGGDTLRSVIERFDGHSFLTMGMEIAYSHHEKWDGSGYPSGAAGDEIPLSARIVALADAYDTITSRRPYKRAMSHEEAVRRIQDDAGAHFDPVLAATFVEGHDDFSLISRALRDAATPIPEFDS